MTLYPQILDNLGHVETFRHHQTNRCWDLDINKWRFPFAPLSEGQLLKGGLIAMKKALQILLTGCVLGSFAATP
ncbi:MAG: hypothetical protein ACKVZH_21705, partial [Blastocatellia bacterium]